MVKKRSRKKTVVKKRKPVTRAVPKKVPKGYKKQSTKKPSVNTRIRELEKKLKEFAKANEKFNETNKKLKEEIKEYAKDLGVSKIENEKLQRVKDFYEWTRAKARERTIKKHRKEIIAAFENARDYAEDQDYDSYDWADLSEDLQTEYDIELEDWLEIMVDEGYTEHEAYDLWYGY